MPARWLRSTIPLLALLSACGSRGDIPQTRAAAVRPPNLTSIRRVARVLADDHRLIVERTIDSSGTIQDHYSRETGEDLSREEVRQMVRSAREFRWQRQGAMSDALRDRWRANGGEGDIPVAGFLLLREHPSRRETRSNEASDVELRRVVGEVRALLRSMGASPDVIASDSPFFRATLTRTVIDALARSGLVAQLDFEPGPPIPMGTQWHGDIGAGQAHLAGWTGVGRRVAIIEACLPVNPTLLSGVIETATTTGCSDWHTVATASTVRSIASPWGVAPGAGILIGNINGYTGGDIFAWALARDADVVNFSYAATDVTVQPPTPLERHSAGMSEGAARPRSVEVTASHRKANTLRAC